MRHASRLALPCLCAAALACAGDRIADPGLDTAGVPGTPVGGTLAAPALAVPNGAVGVEVGAPLSYDATKGGTAFGAGRTDLAYRIEFDGSSNGLTTLGGTVLGQAAAPGVTWATVVATDRLGRTARDRFAIAAFVAGLGVPVTGATTFRYSDAANPLPAHFRLAPNGASALATDNVPADDPITDAGAALGRVLFYDMRLSRNDGLSCGGCHSPFIGFSDTPALSVGFAGGATARHTPALVNARFYRRGRFFWDERAATLEAQVLGPIQNAAEMGMTLDDLVAKLQATAYYPALFQSAFGTPQVTSDRVARALAQYVRALVSADSRYDRAFAGGAAPDFAAVFTPQEVEGEQLFRTTGCARCHTTVAMVSDDVHDTGLDLVTIDTGAGRGRFKAPSLRNVAVRPRFMHDGRFTSLAQVIDFYDAGVRANPDLDPRLRTPDGSPRRLGLTAAQKAALVAFLGTLTDSTFLTAPRFASPFGPSRPTPTPTTPTPPPTPVPPTTPTTPPTTPTAPATASITIQATAYHPAIVTVAPGAVIGWTNLDNARHSATFASGAIGGTPIFTAGTQSLKMPTAPGTYAYQCAVHGARMQGTVIVQ